MAFQAGNPRRFVRSGVAAAALIASAVYSVSFAQDEDQGRRWLGGDHHIHSQYSFLWNTEIDPPVPVLRSHGNYPIPHNAVMARHFGLDWIVATDHGGRAHAKIYMERAYPSLLIAREAVPELIQFYGLELNPPGADHASVIVGHTSEEASQIYAVESRFDAVTGVGRGQRDPAADEEARMLEALDLMRSFAPSPLVIANHPARTSNEAGFGRTEPRELRNWNDAAPEIAIGMEGAPGHQAAGLMSEDFPKPRIGSRGQYPRAALTRGGFDVMTAQLGGVWDSMLGEGRRFWITATSDSHRHWSEGGNDFWPGEYSKTYVFARKSYSDILESLRNGRVFVTTGDLIAELYLSVSAAGTEAVIGESLSVRSGAEVDIEIRVRDPGSENANGDTPAVARVDLIIGRIDPALIEAAGSVNPSTQVIRRFADADWRRDGEYLTMTHRIGSLDRDSYVRIRGTNTEELEPEPDPLGEDPWQDLWFYSNPVFIRVQR